MVRGSVNIGTAMFGVEGTLTGIIYMDDILQNRIVPTNIPSKR